MRGDVRLVLRLFRGSRPQEFVRLALMCAGLAVAVAAFLVGSTVPKALMDRDAVESARAPVNAMEESDAANIGATFAVGSESLGDEPWRRGFVHGADGSTPRPPGVREWPEPGTSLVSPALATAIEDDPDLGIAVGEISGVIGIEGVTHPDELLSYTAVPSDSGPLGTLPLERFGGTGPDVPQHGSGLVAVQLLVLVGGPVLLFLGVSLRLSWHARRQLFWSLGVIGLPPKRAGRIFAGEMTLVSALGAALGVGAFALLQAPLGASGLVGVTWWPHQGRPNPVLVGVVGFTLLIAVRVLARRAIRASVAANVSRHEAEDRLRRPYLALALGVGACSMLGWLSLRAWWAPPAAQPPEVMAALGALAGVTGALSLTWAGPWMVRSSAALLTNLSLPAAVRLGIRGAEFRAKEVGRLVAFITILVMAATFAVAFLIGMHRTAVGDPQRVSIGFQVDLANDEHGALLGDLRQSGYPIIVGVFAGETTAIDIADCSDYDAIYGSAEGCEDRIQSSATAPHQVRVGDSMIVVPPPDVEDAPWDVRFPWSQIPDELQQSTGWATTVTSRSSGDSAAVIAQIRERMPEAHVDSGIDNPELYAAYLQQRGVIGAGVALGFVLGLGTFLLAGAELRWRMARPWSALAALGASPRATRVASAVTFSWPVLLGGSVAAVFATLAGWTYGGPMMGRTDAMFPASVPATGVTMVVSATLVSAVIGYAVGGARFSREVLSDQ